MPLVADRRPLLARARLLGLAGGRRTYQLLARSPLRGIVDSRPVQHVRLRLHLPMAGRDVVELMSVLEAAGVRSWIAGGWGIDALAGEERRRHKDLDLVLDREALPAALDALARRGFAPLPEDLPGAERHTPGAVLPDREIVRDAAGRTIDLHPVDIATWPGAVSEPWATGRIAGRFVPCLSAAAQDVAHRGYPLLDEHRDDVALIASLVGRGAA